MKRRTTLGVLQTEHGNVAVKHPAIAQALYEADQRAASLEQRVAAQGSTLRERTLDLAALQNHWWVRLGEMLGIVRRDARPKHP